MAISDSRLRELTMISNFWVAMRCCDEIFQGVILAGCTEAAWFDVAGRSPKKTVRLGLQIFRKSPPKPEPAWRNVIRLLRVQFAPSARDSPGVANRDDSMRMLRSRSTRFSPCRTRLPPPVRLRSHRCHFGHHQHPAVVSNANEGSACSRTRPRRRELLWWAPSSHLVSAFSSTKDGFVGRAAGRDNTHHSCDLRVG